MCNLYAQMRARAEAARLGRAIADHNGNQPPLPGIFPDYAAPAIVKGDEGQREMRDLRWGMPSPRFVLAKAAERRAAKLRAKGQEPDLAELIRMEPDAGVTNVRNTASPHWARWLAPASRCLVPFTSFCEPDQVGGTLAPVWYALGEDRPLAFFAGVWTPWSGVRKLKTGWEDDLALFGFLTTEPNAEVRAHHDKAMPVILTSEAERELWLSDAPWPEVKHLQRPLPDGALKIVARDVRKDEALPA